ncbi:Zinc knuckle CX2CX4HX4C [Sesbania bispinosa]|nr:Zinc knuckle CX2CX4HX4C [Sesbania bispinosa]
MDNSRRPFSTCSDDPQSNDHNHAPIIIFDENDIDDGVHSCAKSLVGKIITKKPIHTNSLLNALSGMWCNPRGFRVEEIAPKTYQFFFEEEKDISRILNGNPWLFRNSWIVFRRWERSQALELLEFTSVPVRVQLWGLPAHCKIEKMGRKIGGCLGEVNSVDIFETRDRGSFIKLVVIIDTSRPLKLGIHVGSKTYGVIWVDFEYERMPQFCYFCGRIGHEEDFCAYKDSHNDSTNKYSEGNHIKKIPELPSEVLNLLASLSVSKHPDPSLSLAPKYSTETAKATFANNTALAPLENGDPNASNTPETPLPLAPKSPTEKVKALVPINTALVSTEKFDPNDSKILEPSSPIGSNQSGELTIEPPPSQSIKKSNSTKDLEEIKSCSQRQT